jgi:hypothetical protein
MGLSLSRQKKPSDEDIDLKKRVEDYMNAFLDEHCIVDKAAFVPITLLQVAWMEYAKFHGFIKDLEKYERTHRSLLLLPEAVSVDVFSACYMGIVLDSYPEDGH